MYTEDATPGPDIKRRCTDFVCFILFSVYLTGFIGLYKFLDNHSSAEVLSHGYDHCGNLCGVDNPDLNMKYVFYPDLQNDLDLKHKLHQYYGICVEQCPERNAIRHDYECEGGAKEGFRDQIRSSWFVSFPSFPLAGRCMPYEPGPMFAGGALELCADPPCQLINSSEMPTSPQQVCGLKRDKTSTYWLLGEPDESMLEGWQSDPMDLASSEVIAERTRIAKAGEGPTCNVKVIRDTRVRLVTSENEENALHTLITKYTGAAFRVGKALYDNWYYVLGLGIVCTLVVALLTVTFFTCCVRIVLFLLLILLFTTLIAVDYILFFQAGMVTAHTGLSIINLFEENTGIKLPDCLQSNLEVKTEVEKMMTVYEYSAYAVALFTLVVVCIVFAMRKNFNTMIALFNEAARTLRHMPSMLLCPVLLLASIVMVAYMTLYIYLSSSTMDPSSLNRMMTNWNQAVPVDWLHLDDFGNMDNFKTAYGWALLFSFVWFYFFHVAIFTLVTALSVSHWYFYRNDPNQCSGTGWRTDITEGWYPGRPMVLALWRVVWYHLGTAAMGSFVMTLVTMPRIILEYINSQSEADANPVLKGIIWCTRCCLCCLQNCVQFITEYAYVYCAVTGSPFWSSARKSFQLIAKYPVQVALDKMMSRALGFLACLTIPLGMGVVAFLVVKGEKVACALAIVPLAYITTRLVVGVYDVCVTTLFVCVMRDCEQFGGKYMPDRLLEVCGLQLDKEEAVEMRATDGGRLSHAVTGDSMDLTLSR